MEHIYGGEWNSINGMCSEEAEFMAQLLEDATSMYAFSQGSSSYSGGSLLPYPSQETCSHLAFPNNHNNLMDHGEDFLNQDISNDSMESDKNISDDVSQVSKKRSCIPRDVGKNKKCMKMRKRLKIEDSNDADTNNNNNRRSLNNYCSEDESNGKPRAGRGSATDPQSLYARKRRERINERLRILQKLVPNGTKVDISTMLEEAVQYVKFLQLQIKLLSSDDLWMYAPIAYNGMDIGVLELKANIPKPES